MYNFQQLSPLVHQYDFPITDLFAPYINDVIEQFHRYYDDSRGYNSPYFNDKTNPDLQDMFYNIIQTQYKVSDPMTPFQPYVYYQDSKFQENHFHSHKGTSTLNAVCYLVLPKEGGGIEFIDDEKETHIMHRPQVDKLYVFPYWLTHRPLPHTSNDYRISFNLEYLCIERPRHFQTQKTLLW